VLRRDAKSVSVARVAKSASVASAESASVAHEVEGVLHLDAKSVSEGVLLRDAKGVSVVRDAVSTSVAHVVEVKSHDGGVRKSAADTLCAPVRRELPGVVVLVTAEHVAVDASVSSDLVVLEGRCISILFRCMAAFDLEGTYAVCECMSEAGLSLNPGVMQCVLAWVRCVCSLLKLLSDPSFDDFMNEIAVHQCCFPGSVVVHVGGPAPNPRPSGDDFRRARACHRICCLAPGLFDSKCQQAIDECWEKDDFLAWWRMRLFDPDDESLGQEFVECFMCKLWLEESEGFLRDWPYWHIHHKTA
jgi:hypothetical protein